MIFSRDFIVHNYEKTKKIYPKNMQTNENADFCLTFCVICDTVQLYEIQEYFAADGEWTGSRAIIKKHRHMVRCVREDVWLK